MTTTTDHDTPFVYVTKHPSGTVHLTTDRRIATNAQPTTLCGQIVRWSLWEQGDETLSGIAATCRRCASIARKDHR